MILELVKEVENSFPSGQNRYNDISKGVISKGESEKLSPIDLVC